MALSQSQPGVVWFRRDLRLGDNPAWNAATASHGTVVALFVLEPALLELAGQHRRNQLFGHLNALHQELVGLGGGLTIRQGPAELAVPALVAELDATGVYCNYDVSPFSRRRDAAVEQRLGGALASFDGGFVHEPGAVLTGKGSVSQVFSPFYKTWSATPLPDWPEPGPGRPILVSSEPIPQPDAAPRQTSGEAAANARLAAWLEHVEAYQTTRDLPAVDGTSDLSADLKFGTIAPRRIVEEVGTSNQGRAAFTRQIAWRDWWAHTLVERPFLATKATRPEYDKIQWEDDPEGFDAWASGQTGFPIVDAGMRQLVETGWMHNRVRMITASFLVKDLLIDWRLGERFFHHHLSDADTAQNAGNWQWVAGTGPDAAPYFRIFNPTSQSQKFDPTGAYLRRWVPELAALPAKTIHEPSTAGPLDLAAAGVILGDTYPAPIVDHRAARERTLAAYKAVKG